MYIPPLNRVDDPAKIAAFIHAHGFATVITQDHGRPWASHLPVLLDEKTGAHGTLRSHMARANPQWRHFASGNEVLCIFAGPHAYISPSCYVDQHTVPTWNYAVVHVYGKPVVLEDANELAAIVRDTTDKYEAKMPRPWTLPLSEREFGAMLKAIVGFRVAVTRVEAKFKLGQNRSDEDQAGMLRALREASDCGSRELAEFIVRQKITRT
jgi:transcriptional regulator